ncbi:threonine/serine exporter family protein [Brevibacillus migulae]|uniref:threonine/serine exporter family protein n=1 Tax=Brevibacillus migulae TaxID=1644114 RepID=UPI00106EA2D2|nr:threonine/serine exporter family protein [Brevibacillus migulae]
MGWWQGLILSFFSTVAFCMLFNVPIRALLAGGFAGSLGWIIYNVLIGNGISITVATFLAATGVSLSSQLFSVYLRVPSTNFSVAGIIPLVPGSVAYKAMLSFVNGDDLGGITLATRTSLIAGAIASGLILGLSIFSVWKGIVTRNAGTRAKTD